MTYEIRDPFAGSLVIEGETIEEAIRDAYAEVPPEERPEYVWHDGTKLDVPDGCCRPLQ